MGNFSEYFTENISEINLNIMKNQPKVSIIVPAYNVEQYISKTLNSLLRQSFSDYEVLIVNDGSTDGTQGIIKKYLSDKRFRLIKTANMGVSSARNAGFFKAVGDFVCFIDGDDWWDPNFLRKMLYKIESAGTNICYCDYYGIEESGRMLRIVKLGYARENILISYLKNIPPLPMGAMIFRRDFLTQNGILFTPGCTYAEDVEFIIKALITGTVSSIPVTLMYWVRRKTSAIATNLKIKDIYDAFIRSERFITTNIRDKSVADACIREIMFHRLPVEFARVGYVGHFRKIPEIKEVMKNGLFKKVILSFRPRFDKRSLQFFVYQAGMHFPKLVDFILNVHYSIEKYIASIRIQRTPTRRIKICIVCSSGGHLIQAYNLKPWWEKHDRFWVTFRKEDAVSILQGEKVHYAFFPTNRNVKNLIKNVFIAAVILAKERPDVIFSTGAGIAVPFFYIAKLVYLEVYDRVDSPTLTGKLVYPITKKFLVQWKELKKYYPKAEFWGQAI